MWGRRWGRLAIGIIGIVAGCAGSSAAGAEDAAPAVGHRVPDLALRAVEGGRTVELADVLGGRPALLMFWASWCGWCRRELPVLERVEREYGARGLRVVLVSVETGDPARLAERIRAALGPLTVTGAMLIDASGVAQRTYRLRGLPTAFLVDRTGTVRASEIGFRDWTAGAANRQLTELLAR
jgi:thiol-disulfide isomerase/thioredoxin